MSCVFCNIITGAIPSNRRYEDEKCIAFDDIEPVAPVHILVVPKEHLTSVMAVEDKALLGHLLSVAREQAKAQGLDENGFRIVINTGKDGNQSVPHLHLHVIGGRSMQWPPG